ncbi:MAG: hypothetical protein M0P12_00760 [Paludibacteraceae bacterium]|nr:hypothetical protein [Paludibacteraceae bacterium]
MGMGYAGYAVLGSGETAEPILLTSCNINPELNPIISQPAVGFGWKNAADQSHYANGIIDYRGSLGFDLPVSLWTLLNEWAITKRIYAKNFEHSPDGTCKYQYSGAAETDGNLNGAWCDSLGISTSADSTLQATLNILALTRSVTVGLGYSENETGILAASCDTFPVDPLNPLNANNSPIPFWRTKARILIDINGTPTDPDADVNTLSWGIDLANNAQIIKACNAGTGTYGTASAVVMGAMSVTGNIELYKHSGIWDPVLDNPIIASTASLAITVENGLTDKTITLPAIRLDSDDYSLNINGPVSRRFNLKAMGGKCINSVIPAPIIMA